MIAPCSNRDLWRWPTLLLWLIFLLAGLLPEKAFFLLRDLGHVATQNASVNSVWLPVVAMAAYLTFFAYYVCRKADLESGEAEGKALQIAVLALLAFLPLRLEQFNEYLLVPVPEHRRLLIAACTVKCIAWVYLLTLLLRYYCWNGKSAFSRMPSAFSSRPRPQTCIKPTADFIPDQEPNTASETVKNPTSEATINKNRLDKGV